ncbi:MAG: hypothetical protein U9Q92_05190 [archaeon]|nr:hypothetical protein [archaeon]
MKRIVLLGCILAVFVLAGSVEAGNQIDTDDIYIMAYYKTSSVIYLSRAIQEFDYVSESTEQYVEGTVTIWHNYRNGRHTGETSDFDFEIIDGKVTDIPFATDVTVRVKSDGWIVAWLTDEQNMSDMVFWNRVDQYLYPPDTTLGQAIWRITNWVGASYDQNSVGYYSYEYPDADRLLIGGRTLRTGGISSSTYSFLIPSPITLYDAHFLWTSCLESDHVYAPNYGIVKINDEEIYNKSSSSFGEGLYEYVRYSRNIISVPRDTQHAIYLEDSGWTSHGTGSLKSVVALLYKAG